MSNRQNQVLGQNGAFMLVLRRRQDTKWYEVKCDSWRLHEIGNFSPDNPIEEVRDFFDPQRSKSGKYGSKWKFRNRKDAEQMYMTAILRWS